MLDTLSRPAKSEVRPASGPWPIANPLARSRAARWALVAILVVGAYLRFANLGDLGFRWDEDYSGLSVQAVLEKGYPELPSGMVYWRGGPFTYVMAGSAIVFGFNEFALRLPAALFGIALIGAGFLFGRALFGVRAGLLVAGLLALSTSDVEFARYARFYAPFSLFYLLTLYCIWKGRIETQNTRYGVAAIVFAILAIWMHDLGYSLGAAFFFPLLLRGPVAWRSPREWVYPVAAAGLAGAFFLAWSETMNHYRHLPALLAAANGEIASAGIGETPAVAQYLASLGHLPLLDALLERAPLLFAALAAALLAAALSYAAKRGVPSHERFLLAAIALCCSAQAFNVALVLLLVLAFTKRSGAAALRSPEVLFGGVLVALALAVWVGLIVVLGLSAGDGSVRGSVRALLDYPHFFVFWGYPNEWPLASLVATLGALWAFDRAARAAGERDLERAHAGTAGAFLLLALATPLIANGLFASSFELFRYNVPFNALYFMLIALALLHWREALAALGLVPRKLLRGAAGTAATAVLALLALGYDLNPVRSYLVTQRDYTNDGALYTALGLSRYDDYKTPGEFLKTNAGAGDLVLTPFSRETYNYVGRVDYWIRNARYEDQSYTKDGMLRDLYVDSPMLMTFAQFQEVLDTPNRTKWVFVQENDLRRSQTPFDDDIKSYLLEQHDRVVYEALDRNGRIYRFD